MKTVQDDHRLARRLEYSTVAWNIGEAVFTITVGSLAGSLALVAFGTSSIVEVFASVVVIWHLRPSADGARRKVLALRMVSVAFLILAVALGVSGVRDVISGRRAGESWPGVIYLAFTALVMFALAAAKRRVADRLDDDPMRGEAAMTFIDGILSTATLSGLILNAAFGIWWADPLAALVVAAFALNEAHENWEAARTSLPERSVSPPAGDGRSEQAG